MFLRDFLIVLVTGIGIALFFACRRSTPEDRFVEDFLARKYPPVEKPHPADEVICFSAEKSDLTPIDGPNFKRYFPNFTFYTATLFTTYTFMHKPTVLVAYKEALGYPVVLVQFPIRFRDVDPEFPEMFLGTPVQSGKDAAAIARGIAMLLTHVTDDGGSVEPHDESEGQARAKLMRGSKVYRLVDVRYSLETGKVTEVLVYRSGSHSGEVHADGMTCPTCAQ